MYQMRPPETEMRNLHAGQQAESQQLFDQAGQAFANRDNEANMIANAYRRSGFTNVADEYRQAFKHNAFNMARRGLGGGSADIDTQTRNREQATQQAWGVERDANRLYLGQTQNAMNQQFGLQQQAYQNPFSANVGGAGIDAITAQTRRLMGVHDAALDARNAQVGQELGQAQILQQLLAGAGHSVGTGFAMQGGRN